MTRDGKTRERLRDMRGLGPQSEKWLIELGIQTPDELRAQDPFDVYARLWRQRPGVSLNALYALIGAVEGRNWLDIKRERRMEIVLRLDEMGLTQGAQRL